MSIHIYHLFYIVIITPHYKPSLTIILKYTYLYMYIYIIFIAIYTNNLRFIQKQFELQNLYYYIYLFVCSP